MLYYISSKTAYVSVNMKPADTRGNNNKNIQAKRSDFPFVIVVVYLLLSNTKTPGFGLYSSWCPH